MILSSLVGKIFVLSSEKRSNSVLRLGKVRINNCGAMS